MDITSPPAVVTETVIDVDVQFTFGQSGQWTLRGQDRIIDGDTSLIVERESGEVVIMYKTQVMWWGQRTRIVHTPVKGQDKTQSPPSQARLPFQP